MYKDNNETALKGESYIYQKLLDQGIVAKWSAFTNRKSTEDFITETGITIDVKTAYPKAKSSSWAFNVHHHGVKQINIDFFICILLPLNKIFIIPSELISNKTYRISKRQLERGKYDYFLENWDLIKNFTRKDQRRSIKKQERIKLDRMNFKKTTDEIEKNNK